MNTETSPRKAWLAPSVVLGIIGLAVTGAGIYVSRPDRGTDAHVTRYQQQVLAVCARIQSLPNTGRDLTPDARGRYSKAMLLELVTTNATGTTRELELLESTPAPDELKEATRRFTGAKEEYLRWGNETIARAERDLPATFTSDQLETFIASMRQGAVEASTEIASAMTALAGSDCRLA